MHRATSARAALFTWFCMHGRRHKWQVDGRRNCPNPKCKAINTHYICARRVFGWPMNESVLWVL